jgi:hypothetical protein
VPSLANVKKTFDENFSLDNQRSICEMITEDEEEDEEEDADTLELVV